MRLFLIAVLAGLVGVSAQAKAQERLIAAPPAGWEMVYDTAQGSAVITQFVPPGQSMDRWDEMMVVQVMRGLKTLPPDLFLAEIPVQMERVCDSSRLGVVQGGEINGYPAAFQVVECPLGRNSGRGEVSMFLVVQGAQNLYAMQRVWSVPAFPESPMPVAQEKIEAALLHLRAQTVCDPRNAAHPCP